MPWADALRRAVALHQGGDLASAEQLYHEVLILHPDNFDARHLLGVLRAQQGRHDDAQALIQRALSLRPGDPQGLASLGKVQMALGDFTGALKSYDRALASHPGNPDLLYARGNALREAGDLAAAEQSYLAATRAHPGFADAFSNRGAVLGRLGRVEEALACFDRATRIAPGLANAWNNRASLLCEQGRLGEAVESASRAIALKPGFAEAFANRGGAHWQQKKIPAALVDFNQALAINPNLLGALSNRARLLWSETRDYEPARRDLEHLLRLDPDFSLTEGDLFYVRASIADWKHFDDDALSLIRGVRAGRPVVQPFIFQAFSTSPADLLSCAATHAAREYPPQPPLAPAVIRERAKIRLGYVCGEFRGHATSYLSVGLFEQHDRDTFEVIGFDNGAGDDSPTRKRLESGLDRIVPITDMGDRQAAERIRAEEVDILINLNGYYGAHRMGVFAHRPAPIQVNWLGFPGTLGAPYIDYIIADPIVLPDDERQFFTEQVVWLPESYQVNDDRRRIAPRTRSRAEAGLPGDVFVFCNFNQPYKLSPAQLQAWLAILARVPHSVLWLWADNPTFELNVKLFAVRHGIAMERIVIAGPMPVEDHLARLKLADLFLDSLPYNAHTTASDALWAGLPLLTQTGTTFAGRVATSLLVAAGLPELVTATPQEYKNRAIELAHNPQELHALRDRLAAARNDCCLFDTERFCRHIESAYRDMWKHKRAGLAPQPFAVRSDSFD
ncbi:MAG TPA: tetratricopeptide repeat protein [Rhizomicrobium sp.]|jgi:predicted O-linked N-acetylglucosamine transferase (SPINDLY family)/TolA-binding protein